jgi:hypothetical protein
MRGGLALAPMRPASIHPSGPWPLAGHPEAMNMSCCRDHFHTSAWKVGSANFALTEFSDIRMYGVLESQLANRAGSTVTAASAAHSVNTAMKTVSSGEP